MRLLLAVHHFPPRYTYGAELQAFRTARELVARGHEVLVLCVEDVTSGSDELRWRDETYQGIPVRRLTLALPSGPDAVRWEYDHPQIREHVAGLLASMHPDLVHLFSGYLLTGSVLQACLDESVPSVVTLTDYWFLCPRITLVRADGSVCTTPADPAPCAFCLRSSQRRYRLPDRATGGLLGLVLGRAWKLTGDRLVRLQEDRARSLRRAIESANVLISPSRFLLELLGASGVNVDAARHIRQGIDTSPWAPATRSVDDEHLRIGYIGQIAPHKGVDVLLDAFARLRPTGKTKTPYLAVYGDTTKSPQYTRRLVRKARSRRDITFAGSFDNTQIRRVHAGIDLLVVPSIWYENSPSVILEAHACGTPVVAARFGGMAELVRDGIDGLLATRGDAKDLARVLQRFLDEPPLLDQLRRGIPRVGTVADEIRELEAVYRSAVSGSPWQGSSESAIAEGQRGS